MTFRAAIPNTARNPTSEPIETLPLLSNSRQHTTDERRRQRDEGQDCQPPAGENNLQQQQDANGRGNRIDEDLPLGGLPFGIFAEELGVVFQRKLDLREAFLNVGDDGGKITPARIGADVDAPSEILSW